MYTGRWLWNIKVPPPPPLLRHARIIWLCSCIWVRRVEYVVSKTIVALKYIYTRFQYSHCLLFYTMQGTIREKSINRKLPSPKWIYCRTLAVIYIARFPDKSLIYSFGGLLKYWCHVKVIMRAYAGVSIMTRAQASPLWPELRSSHLPVRKLMGNSPNKQGR